MNKAIITLIMIAMTLIYGQETKVSMNFQGVEMSIFLQWLGNHTGKKIIYNQEKIGTKKVYLVAPQSIPEKEVEKICMSLLESNGFTLIKVGKGGSEVYKLVETTNAASKPIAIYTMEELEKIESGDYYISQLIMIKHLKASNVINSIRQAKLLDQQSGSIVEITGANALIVSDFVPNVKRIIEIIRMIDKSPPKIEIEFLELKYGQANDISQRLQQLFQNRIREQSQYNMAESTLTIVPDARTNSLTIRGTKEEIEEVKRIIGKFDKEIKGSEIIHKIYKLQNVTVDKVLPTLKEFVNTMLFKEKSGTSGNNVNTEIAIISNEYTKTIIITASKSAHKYLEEVIKQLDVRRPQVLLETVICEFSPSDVLNFGFEVVGLENVNKVGDGTYPHATTSFGLSSLVDEAGKAIDEKNPGLPVGKKISSGTGLTTFITKDSGTNIPILLKAIQSVTKAEILSTPRILADDGEKAEIRVQKEVPVTSTNALNTSTSTTSFKEFVSAGTILTIKPQIIYKNWLRLEIEQSIEDFIGNSPSLGVPPPKSSRLLKTTVTVPSGKMVILGGLCDRREIETVDKIPILGDIPTFYRILW